MMRLMEESMYSKREVFVLASLLERIAKRYGGDRHIMRTVYNWLEENELRLRFDLEPLERKVPLEDLPRRGLTRRQTAAVVDAISVWKQTHEGAPVSAFEENAETFAKSVGLAPFERALFVAMGLVGSLDAFQDLAREMADQSDIQPTEIFALMLDAEKEKIAKAVEKGPLVDAGLLAVGEDGDTGTYVPWNLRAALSRPKKSVSQIEEKLIGTVEAPETAAEDHAHYAKDRDFVIALLKGALEKKAKGVNILVYGPTGTGKTEFSRMVAQEINAQLYSVGEKTDDSAEPERDDRLSALLLAQRLVAQREDAVLLFDEMDDLLVEAPSPFGMFMMEGTSSGASKVFLHRMLENNEAPTLWTTNSIRGVDEAVLRRMTYTMEMRVPPIPVRARIWTRIADKHGFGTLTQERAEELARRYEVSPALIENAMKTALLTGGGEEALITALDQTRRAVYGEAKPPVSQEGPYVPELVNADVDLLALAEKLSHPDSARNFSLLFTGPPGTGKTAFVRYLAEKLGMDVLHKRASDLMSMWVGQTEQQIAEAFREAADTGQFLVFDEADSMLYDRRNAVRSFEVSQVNEMLTWMEAHPLPFACTSNLKDGIDQAAMRRFTFKVKVDYLKPPQAAHAFRSFFKADAPEGLAKLDVLTPGDFAVVSKKLRFMGDVTPDDLVAMLKLECEAKADYKPAGSIGFQKQ